MLDITRQALAQMACRCVPRAPREHLRAPVQRHAQRVARGHTQVVPPRHLAPLVQRAQILLTGWAPSRDAPQQLDLERVPIRVTVGTTILETIQTVYQYASSVQRAQILLTGWVPPLRVQLQPVLERVHMRVTVGTTILEMIQTVYQYASSVQRAQILLTERPPSRDVKGQLDLERAPIRVMLATR